MLEQPPILIIDLAIDPPQSAPNLPVCSRGPVAPFHVTHLLITSAIVLVLSIDSVTCTETSRPTAHVSCGSRDLPLFADCTRSSSTASPFLPADSSASGPLCSGILSAPPYNLAPNYVGFTYLSPVIATMPGAILGGHVA